MKGKNFLVLEKWHEVVKTGDSELLDQILAEDVVFHSPVVHTPLYGKAITKLYLLAAQEVLGGDDFVYTKEFISGDHCVLEFTKKVEGIHINGVDIITFDDKNQITEFKVMVRPLKAMEKVHQKMGEMLLKFQNRT